MKNTPLNLKTKLMDKELTKEQLEAIQQAQEILATVGLEIIGTRPPDR